MDWVIFLLAATSFVSEIDVTSGIWCYQCAYIEGRTDPDCLYPSKKFLVNCSALIPIDSQSQDVPITSWDYCETGIGCRVNSKSLGHNRAALHRSCSPGITPVSVDTDYVMFGNESVIVEYIPEGDNQDGGVIQNLTIWMCKFGKCNRGLPFEQIGPHGMIFQSHVLKTVCNGYAKLGHLTIFLVVPFFVLLPSGFS